MAYSGMVRHSGCVCRWSVNNTVLVDVHDECNLHSETELAGHWRKGLFAYVEDRTLTLAQVNSYMLPKHRLNYLVPIARMK